VNDMDQKLRKHYKSEADENLFDSLQFDSRMKERIRSGIHPETKRSDDQGWFNRRRMKWIYGSITAAVAVFTLFIVIPMLQSPSPSSPPIQSGTTLITPIEGDHRELHSAEEAQQVYGRDLYLPAYTPDSYMNDKIVAYGTTDGPISRVVFHYYADDTHSYELSVEKNTSIEAFANDEKIVFNGVTGYIHSDAKIGTTLFWMVDDNLYSIIGSLTREETLKVVESIKY
jgi:hypothetical protein